MTNHYLERKKRKGKQPKAYWRSRNQEKKTAKDVRGYRIRGSGSGYTKGDVRNLRVCRIECKATSKKSFSVTRAMVEKIENAAIGNDEIPAIAVEFLNDSGKPELDVAVIPYHALVYLLEVCQRSKES